MCAAAALLAVGQISNALGVRDKGTGAQNVLYRLWLTLTQGDPLNARAIGIAAATLLLAVVGRKLIQRYRLARMDMITVLIIVALAAYFAAWTIPNGAGKTAIAVAGSVPRYLPTPHIPSVKLGWIGRMAPDALAIAFLGLLEALAIAKAIANQTGQKLDFNRQCLAEGIANLVGGFFRCLPGSGSLSRSAINFQAGGATRFTGIIAAGAVALAVVVLAPLARFVPRPALAALLLLTAARLIDVKRIRYAFRASRQDAAVLIITIAAALAFGLDTSILVGIGLSIVLYVSRATRLRCVELVISHDGVVRERLPADPPSSSFVVYDLEGELFFGAAPDLERSLAEIAQRIAAEGLRYAVLRLKRVRNPDAVCLEQLEHFLRAAGKRDVVVLLAGLRPDLLDALGRLRFLEWFASDRMFPQGKYEDSATLAAIRVIYERLGAELPEALSQAGTTARDQTARLYYQV